MGAFERDLVEAEREIVIASPGLRLRKVERMLFLLKPRQEAGVRVTVVTLHPEVSRFDAFEDLQNILALMRGAGLEIVLTDPLLYSL